MILRPATLHANRRGAVHVPLTLLGLPERLDVLGRSWEVKPEFHVTAIESRFLAALVGGDLDRAWAAVERALPGHQAGAVRLTGELRECAEDDDRTIIAMAEVEGLAAFVAAVEAALGVPVPVPPAHVTLYTCPPGPGIGLHTPGHLETLTRVLAAPEAATVRALTGLPL